MSCTHVHFYSSPQSEAAVTTVYVHSVEEKAETSELKELSSDSTEVSRIGVQAQRGLVPKPKCLIPTLSWLLNCAQFADVVRSGRWQRQGRSKPGGVSWDILVRRSRNTYTAALT